MNNASECPACNKEKESECLICKEPVLDPIVMRGFISPACSWKCFRILSERLDIALREKKIENKDE